MLLLTLRGHTRQVSGVAFSPDGRRLATAGWDEKARIWDTETGEELLTLAVPSGRVFTVAFSPDGHLLATGGGDKIIRLWEATPLVPHAASQEP
jgi:WD40 repeat protein